MYTISSAGYPTVDGIGTLYFKKILKVVTNDVKVGKSGERER